MAVTRLTKVRNARISEDKVTGIVTVYEPWLMHLDNPRQPRKQLMLEKPEFAAYQPHPDEPRARCVSAEIIQRKHSLIYDVLVNWSSNITVPDNPYDDPAVITVETVSQPVPFTHDYEDNPNTNTAGDFLEGAEDEEMLLVFRLTKKLPPNHPSWLLDYGGVMNSDTVTIHGQSYKPKELKVAKVRIGEVAEQDDVPYVPLSMEIVRHPNTWEREFLNRGVQEIGIARKKDGNGGYVYYPEKMPILDANFRPITTPQFLDEDGRRPRTYKGKAISLQEELKQLNYLFANNTFGTGSSELFTNGLSEVKHPLDPEDIITLKRTRKKPRPFNGVLPLN